MRYTLSALAAILAAVVSIHTPAAEQPAASSPALTQKLVDTQAALRDLWIGHIFWVRNVVDARFARNAAADEAAQAQVVANAKAIAASIEPYYGKAASEKLFQLLAGHWGAINDYLDATRASNRSAQDKAYQALVANAGEIATFLGGANPNLPVGTLRGLLTAHGAHHVQQIQQFQARQYAEEAKTWGAMTDHMYTIADALAGGIAKQFPDKFR